jgi:hypothetical protein
MTDLGLSIYALLFTLVIASMLIIFYGVRRPGE